MTPRNLYFATNCEHPEFPLSAAAKHFHPIGIPREPDDQSWFDWEKPGCLVCESQDSGYISRLLQQIRSSWISVPTVLFCPTELKDIPEIQTSGFSLVISAEFDADFIMQKLIETVDRDRLGDPSPLQLRRRFGKLANQERRVLKLSLNGQTSKEIASKLEIRYQTVDKYRRNALHRMQAKNLVVLLRQLYSAMNLDSQNQLVENRHQSAIDFLD